MSFTFKFEKILGLREREKDEQAFVYEKAIRKFEEVAQRLYDLLKKKEDLEEAQSKKIQQGIPIQEIRMQQQFIQNIQKEILYYQKLVNRARQNMEYEEKRLLDKNIEVKKLEKIKNNDFMSFLTIQNMEESKIMDEISMQIVAREK